MDPSPSHFAQGTVGENRGVFNWNVALIVETIRDPTAQRIRRKLAVVHRDMERMFIVISAHADCPQFFNKRFAIPESRGHKAISRHHKVILTEAKSCGLSFRLGCSAIGQGCFASLNMTPALQS